MPFRVVMVLSLLAGAPPAAQPAATPAAPPSARPAVPPKAQGGARPASVNSLVNRIVDAYGGREPLARGKAFRQEGTVTSALHPGVSGRIERVYARPARLRVVTRFPGSPDEVRIVEGARGWRDGEPVTGPRLSAMVLHAARLDLPALLDAWRQKVVDRGEVTVDGVALRVLALEVGPELTVEAFVDPTTGRILRSTGKGASAGMPLEFETRYEDFRTVGGLLFAFHEGNFANGSVAGETLLEKVEVLPALPAAAFRP